MVPPIDSEPPVVPRLAAVALHAPGLTLIEPMIVTENTGILATFAVPACRDHLIRPRVAEGIVIASAATMRAAKNSAAGTVFCMVRNSAVASANVNTVTIDTANGANTATYTARACGGTVVLEPTPALDVVIASPSIETWRRSCGTRAPRHRPAGCRA